MSRLADLALRALRVEVRIYESLWRAIARRPSIPRGAQGFRYHRPVLTILVIFIVLSAIEIPILDLVVHRWLPLRIVFLVLGIWGLTWMLGLLCAYLTRPHTVGPEARVPGLPPKGGEHEVTLLRFWADEPEALLEAVRDRLGEWRRRADGSVPARE